MAERIPAWRRQLTAYPRQAEIQPRFADLDPLDHLNNVSIARIFEEARVRLLMEMFGENYRAKGVRVVTAQSTVRYFAEARFPAPITVASGILNVGRSSYVIVQAMYQSGRFLGTCDTVHVSTAEGGEPTPLSDWMRGRLSDLLVVEPSAKLVQT